MVKMIPFLTLIITIICIGTASQQSARIVAEFEPCQGALISWPLGIPSELVVELAKDDTLYVAVASQNDQNNARSQFTSWGVNLNHCVFFQANTDTHWSRDWGPDCTFDSNGVGGILDFTFNGYPHVNGCGSTSSSDFNYGGFTNDDKVNSIFAKALGWPLRTMPTYFTGGNNMVDGITTAISSQLMLDENASHSINAETFKNNAMKYCGITNYYFVDNPEPQGIQHIDCFAKYLDEETILIKQVDKNNSAYSCVEKLADRIKSFKSCYGRPYKIYRILCGAYSGDDVAAYTNSIIVNKKVYVPLFGISTDQAALETFRKAMPGYKVMGFKHGNQWYYYDALHCRVMGVFDRFMLRIVHRSIDSLINVSSDIPVSSSVSAASSKGLIQNKCLVFWRKKGAPTWDSIPMKPVSGLDSMNAFIPAQASGTTIEYYLQAADSSGRTVTLPRTAPDWVYSFKINQGKTSSQFNYMDQIRGNSSLKLLGLNTSPVIFSIQKNERISLFITDPSGKQIKTLLKNAVVKNTVFWNSRNQLDQLCPEGVYLAVLKTSKSFISKRIVISR
jgi:agmatine/peptidylarginine deiminase